MILLNDVCISLKDIRSIHYVDYGDSRDMKIVYCDGGKIYIKVLNQHEYRAMVDLIISTIDKKYSMFRFNDIKDLCKPMLVTHEE